MGNHTYKKKEAEEFNANRKQRLVEQETKRLDKLNNPEKYCGSKRSKARAN